MSREEKELAEAIETRINAQLDKLRRSVMGFFFGGIATLLVCAFYLGMIYYEHKEMARWKDGATETLASHSEQIIKIKTKLNIQ